LYRYSLDDDEDGEKKAAPSLELNPDEVEAARAAAALALVEWRDNAAGGAGSGMRAQELWARLELLTGALSGELAVGLAYKFNPVLPWLESAWFQPLCPNFTYSTFSKEYVKHTRHWSL
jgi:hypothetical protein